jgi:hypothetical protein
MLVASYHVGFLSGLLAPFATLRSLLEPGGSTLNHADGSTDGGRPGPRRFTPYPPSPLPDRSAFYLSRPRTARSGAGRSRPPLPIRRALTVGRIGEPPGAPACGRRLHPTGGERPTRVGRPDVPPRTVGVDESGLDGSERSGWRERRATTGASDGRPAGSGVRLTRSLWLFGGPPLDPVTRRPGTPRVPPSSRPVLRLSLCIGGVLGDGDPHRTAVSAGLAEDGTATGRPERGATPRACYVHGSLRPECGTRASAARDRTNSVPAGPRPAPTRSVQEHGR